MAELGLPGADSSGIWARKGLRDLRSPPRPRVGLGGDLSAGRDCGCGVRAVLVLGSECNVYVLVHGANANPNKGRMGLRCAMARSTMGDPQWVRR